MNDFSEFKQKFRHFTKLCTEDYLIRYANKGLYKRALKELDQGVQVQYTWNTASVSCQLSEGIECTLYATLDEWQCSCPSENICKHVLIAILYDQRQQTTENSAMSEDIVEVVQVAEPSADIHASSPDYADPDTIKEYELQTQDKFHQVNESERLDYGLQSHAPEGHVRFRWMLEADLTPILKSYTSTMVEEVVFRLGYSEDIQIMEDTLLTVLLKIQNIEVSFTEEPQLTKALCKLKQTAGKMAKLEALLRYRICHGVDDTDALSVRAYEPKFSLQTIQECRDMLGGMLKTGLARLPQSYNAQLETLAIAAHSGNLPEIERSLRGIQGELQLFFKRHVRFSMQTMLDRISKLYLALEVLEQGEIPVRQQSQLVGSFRSKYFTVPSLHLYGLGADSWETRSGFRGITYYFYCFDDGQIYTYSDVRAVYYEDQQFSFAEHYAAFTPWLPSLTFSQFTGEEVQFQSVKVNEERRISSGDGAKLTILPRTGVTEVDFGEYLIDISAALQREPDSIDLFTEPKERLALIEVARITEHSFNKQTQDLILMVENTDGARLPLTLPYSSDWQSMINRLESGFGSQKLEHFYAFVRIETKRISPISFLKGQTLLSLKLDSSSGRMGRFGRR
ncbi:SWIM zinc finger family protein [Paenibacillus polysaccharolyticus]|uniref:SWIM zinc finger family protein n=1 Tax=Paenibacillus polysaccharolyticus TaxID=582692 RepID=UPI00209FC956|nr:SWIM zinc finger family protein [Paenibacillus polysaccharolyticus]MCP1133610.1 SWIM zinc finger family protein [Paenibacillus polysaccharolyticus]